MGSAAVPAVLFVLMPATYCLSHFLIVDIDVLRALGGDVVGAVDFTQSNARLIVYAVAVGVPFGLMFGTLLCLPARLFGRRALPTLQSTIYSAMILSTAICVPFFGFLHHSFEGYEVVLLLTFGCSATELIFFIFLMRADKNAAQPDEYYDVLEVVEEE